MEDIGVISITEEKKIIWGSFLQACRDSYVAIAALFGGVIVIPLIFHQYGNTIVGDKYNLAIIVASILLSLLSYCGFVLYHFPMKYSHNYNSKVKDIYTDKLSKANYYGQSHGYLSAAFAIIHKMNRIENLTFEIAVAELGKFCTLIKEFFEVKNGEQCSCCIKILIKDGELEEGDFRVITLCRDSKSDVDREPANAKRIHAVKDNTCFMHFFENINTHEGRFFLSNDLIKRPEYKNSSMEYYRNSTSEPWKLPYKSELVVPLIAKIPDDGTPVLGFFCVDSKGIENFNSNFDPEMLIGIADGLYNTLYNQVNKHYGIASRD